MTLAARIAPHMPPALNATGVGLLYPRYEPAGGAGCALQPLLLRTAHQRSFR